MKTKYLFKKLLAGYEVTHCSISNEQVGTEGIGQKLGTYDFSGTSFIQNGGA